MRCQRRSRRFAKAGEDVYHAGGNASFDNQFRQSQCSERHLLGGFQHDGATRRERRRNLPRRHQQRKVPLDDLAYHADRFANRVGQILAGQ